MCIRDSPKPETDIMAGHPILTLHVSGESQSETEQALAQAFEVLETILRERLSWPSLITNVDQLKNARQIDRSVGRLIVCQWVANSFYGSSEEEGENVIGGKEVFVAEAKSWVALLAIKK